MAAKMGFGSDRARVVREFGHRQQITCCGQTIRVKSDAETTFFQELDLCWRVGLIESVEYEPKAFPLEYKYNHCDCRDTYTPDFRVVWKNEDEVFYEVKRGALTSKYANKVKRFAQQYQGKKLVLVWIGNLPKPRKRNGKANPIYMRLEKLKPWVTHIWQIKAGKRA